MNIISIIPARGGSKRVPNKNLRLLAKQPLVAISIRHSLASKLISRTIVSTDSTQIANVAREHGAEVILRPAELATGTAGTVEVCQHLVREVEASGEKVDAVVLLQPTSPFRNPVLIDEYIQKLLDEEADLVLAVEKVKMGPKWLMEIKENQLEFRTQNDFQEIRTQDQPDLYRPSGALYIYSRASLMQATAFPWGDKVIPLVLEAPYNLDIDHEIDLQIAECLAHEYLF